MKQFVTEQHHEQALESLSELIRIPSVLDEADSGQGHPFGKKVIEALVHHRRPAPAQGQAFRIRPQRHGVAASTWTSPRPRW